MKKQTILLLTFVLSLLQYVNAQEISTVSEIYDFEIGDEFHVWMEYGAVLDEHKIVKITEKFYSENGETLNYYRQIIGVEYDNYNSQTTYFEYTDTVSYSNLDEFVNFGNVDSVFIDPEQYNQRQVNRDDRSNGSIYITSDYDYIVGCGGPYWYYDDLETWTTSHSFLVYFKKGDEEWGNQLIVGTEEIPKDVDGFEVCPNPAYDFVCLSQTKNFDKAQVKIYNSLGQLVYANTITSENTVVDVSGFKRGMYIVLIETDDGVLKEKLVIR